MSMSRAEAAEMRALERRIVALEERMAGFAAAVPIPDDIGADHAAHVAAFPKKVAAVKKPNA